jgi:4a-hydroxytetrahydrobiopterin dehydratase
MARLTDLEVEDGLTALDGWRFATGEGPPSIEREFKLADFAAALAFVNRVGDAAEAADHHPDILLHGWNKVLLTLSTHSEGGLTKADFDLAGRIDGLS